MTDKELRKLSRAELLELLIAQMKENDELRRKLDHAGEQIKNREIKLEEAGSIAEAALKLNGVFEAADAAVQQYLANIKSLHDRQQEVCERMEAETRKKCDDMVAEAEKHCSEREKEMASSYQELADKLKKFCDVRPETAK